MATNQWGPIYSESDGVVNSPDNRFDVENLPSPPAFNSADGESSTESFVSGSVQTTQHGSPAISTAPVIAGCTSVQWNAWNSGTVGSTGNKFS